MKNNAGGCDPVLGGAKRAALIKLPILYFHGYVWMLTNERELQVSQKWDGTGLETYILDSTSTWFRVTNQRYKGRYWPTLWKIWLPSDLQWVEFDLELLSRCPFDAKELYSTMKEALIDAFEPGTPDHAKASKEVKHLPPDASLIEWYQKHIGKKQRRWM